MLMYSRVGRLSEPDDIILDLGSKDGRYLDKINAKTIALDIELAKGQLSDEAQSYILGDGCELPFQNNVFDYIILGQVLEHISYKIDIIKEVKRVLKPHGAAFFSFPNRYSPSKPHGLPRFLSAVPKSIGLEIAKPMLTEEKYTYYRDCVFPLSPLHAKRLLSRYFSEIEYVTVDESIKSPEIYSDRLLPQTFVNFLPLISLLTNIPLLELIFETVWSYCSYECSI